MSTPTLAEVVARQDELAAMIAKLQSSAATATATATATVDPRTVIDIPAFTVELRPGEHYAGAVLDAEGQIKHHLVLMARKPTGKLNWTHAAVWAESIGGALPTPQEQALLYANCKQYLEPAWHWSCQEHEDDASYAWCCDFCDGDQYSFTKSSEGCAVAVRRLSPSILQSV